jgi:hypothetical protein
MPLVNNTLKTAKVG